MKPHRRQTRRRGIVLVFVAVILVLLIALAALAVDLGYVYAVRQDLQVVADAAALAAASGLSVDQATARQRAREYAGKNPISGAAVELLDADIELGLWNGDARVFTPLADGSPQRPHAVRVTPRLSESRGSSVGLYFARALGIDTLDIETSAIAVYGSRDIVLTLDYSASMDDDTSLAAIDRLGENEVTQRMAAMWAALGSPQYGDMQFDPVRVSSVVHSKIYDALGLNGVSYPYPSGSWDEYFRYVYHPIPPVLDFSVPQEFHKYYGYLTFLDYLQAIRPGVEQTPDLWKTPQQPITAVKDAVGIFFLYMNQERTNDRVALVGYTDSEGDGILEAPLTDDYFFVMDTLRHRQAGHYFADDRVDGRKTNIAGGIEDARAELLANGRSIAARMIVLLSDGDANWLPGFSAEDRPPARAEALHQAHVCADAGIPIITISLGTNANVPLMQEIADITGGIHFIVPGGDDVSDYEEDLIQVFAQIAAHRPLVLVD